MRIIDCVQGSDSWWLAKCGIPSASNFHRIITAKKMQLASAASLDNYISELIAETACQSPTYFSTRGVSRAVVNGADTEPEARNYYSMLRDVDVRQVGFCLTDDGRFGCSPDGLIDPDGGLELKCPLMKTQVAYLMKEELPPEYKAQVHGSLIVTGRAYWDFLSYCPLVKPLLIRVYPDVYTDALRLCLEVFWDRFQKAKERLT